MQPELVFTGRLCVHIQVSSRCTQSVHIYAYVGEREGGIAKDVAEGGFVRGNNTIEICRVK